MAKQLLKDTVIKNIKPGVKDTRLNDGNGLYLLVKPEGAKWRRFDYSIGGKRKTLSLGVYPVTGLSDARRKADEACIQISNQTDPSRTRKDAKAALKLSIENESRRNAGLPMVNSFEEVARQWLASTAHTVSELTHNKKIRRFEVHVFPAIGTKGINDIKSPDIFSLVKPLFNKLETAHRVHSEVSAAFSYAIAHGFTDYNPSQASSAQIPAKKVEHRAALTEPKDVGQLLRDINGDRVERLLCSALSDCRLYSFKDLAKYDKWNGRILT